MGDGMSGLSLSEMGISTVKKTQKAVQSVTNQVVQQVTGQAPAQPNTKPEVDESGNPVTIFQKIGNQVAGTGSFGQQKPQQTPQGSMPTSLPKPQSSQPPSEIGPKQPQGFDLSSGGGEQNLFNAKPAQQTSEVKNAQQQKDFAKQNTEDEEQIKKLRNTLHNLYYDELEKKIEGKDEQKQKEEQEKRHKEQEEEQKKQQELEQKKKQDQELPFAVQGRQGAHEGLKKQG